MTTHHQNCRMYENKFPEVDDVVMVEVTSIQEMGAYVHLLEYDNMEGMIPLSEVSRRRIRSINKLVKVGRQEPVLVLRVDKDKGYIDLSKRRLNPEDTAKCEEKYNKSKLVHSIMRHVSETQQVDLVNLYSVVAWPLYKQYGHAFDAFKHMVAIPDELWDALKQMNEEAGRDTSIVTPAVKDAVMKNLKRRLTPQPLKIRADLEMTCYTFGGVEHIKDAMRKAEAESTEHTELKMKLVAPPLYVLTTQTLDIQEGLGLLMKACNVCKEVMEACKGKLIVKHEPRVVSAQDDRLLDEQMENLGKANAEVDGDDDVDDEADDFGEGISGPVVEE